MGCDADFSSVALLQKDLGSSFKWVSGWLATLNCLKFEAVHIELPILSVLVLSSDSLW